MLKKHFLSKINIKVIFLFVVFLISNSALSQVKFEKEVKISDIGLHFNGSKVTSGASNTGVNAPYDYFFGRNISAHGDCITSYGDYVFVTWYKGDKAVRNVMLTRYNTKTNTSVTLEFPHRHTGYQNRWWIGESHNTIAVGVSPLDGTIHLLYDMHSYSRTRPSDGSLSNDYFRYSYSVKSAASISDEEFTLDKFVKNSTGGYKHLSLNGGVDYNNFSALTYPKFFTNDSGDLFMYMREGGNNNGAYKFSKYNASSSTWSDFTHFNVLNARSKPGITYNWGLYGNIKYVNGKMRIGYQRRSQNNNDKYQYQNGVYYAYSDDQNGFTQWKNHKGENFSLPLFDADKIKVMEPGDYVQTTQANKVHIVGDFDWTVTEKGDVHIISRVKDNQFNVTKRLHTYKPAGALDFITSENFVGGSSIYTAGDDVFIIGLKNNRIFIQKAEGGTNNFTTVYQATSGRTFDHGVVHIANGKLYYYLMENKSGSAQPLYLQIIDLAIVQEPFRIALTSPSNDQSVKIDETVKINANAVNENGTISKVEFKIDDIVFDIDQTAPYSVDWSPSNEGVYKLQAIAYNNSNETVSSNEIKVNVIIPNPNDLTGDTYRIKNVATGKYLKSVGNTIVDSSTGDSEDTKWEFLKSPANDNFYNIDSKVSGTIRVTGANQLISSTKNEANSDTDKTWTIIYNKIENNYTFQVRTSTRYLSNNSAGMQVSNTINDESKWVLESTSTLNLDNDILLNTVKVSVYPNPAKNNFTLSIKGFTSTKIQIFDILGKKVYEEKTSKKQILINNNKRFNSGVYLIRVIGDRQKVVRTKLIID